MNLAPSFALLAGLLVMAVQAHAATLYVATNGNDGWSGRSPDRVAQDGPFATLDAAIKSARLLGGNVTIQVRGGVYPLAQPILLTGEDSGKSAQEPFRISAYPGEKPVLSGGRPITGWKQSSTRPELWQVTLPEVKSGAWYFRSLFVDGARQQRARSPNKGFFRVQGASPQTKPARIHFKAGDIKPPWANADVELVGLFAWSELRMKIKTVDTAQNVAVLSANPSASNQESNARYYIENAADALDEPGEWFLDKQSGQLSYLAEPGRDLTRSQVIAPVLTNIFRLKGEPTKPVQHIDLLGLTFSFTDWAMGPEGYADTQAAIRTRGDLVAEFTVDCVIQDCSLTELSNYAIELGRGCQRNRVVGNEISNIGGGGIRVGETAKRAAPADATFGNVMTDNHIHNLGMVYPPAVGVLILQSGTNRLAYNHIHHLYYSAVSVGWNWGYQETPCRENIVEFNDMHHIGQNMLSDMGAVYTLGIQKGTAIRNNLIHDVESFTYGGWGLYPDEGSTGILWENNIVYRCKSAGFHQHYGKENIVRNNIFAFNRENQLMRTRPEPHTSFIFTNNIVLYDSGNLLGSDWSNDHYVMDYNVYFDTRAKDPAGLKFANGNLEQWRKRGHDEHSVLADPKFVDAQKFDFTLRPESPALKLGFKPIDPTRIGIRPKAERR
ncbi:MAG TPA: right-handed parallel beta-helix repeat-containing protein [Candidatus Saccharimonadales bacterium]|nr:right-handed parallel beta-helix repeat-containing protein [Candidatus Saccharimonadales bacterium]